MTLLPKERSGFDWRIGVIVVVDRLIDVMTPAVFKPRNVFPSAIGSRARMKESNVRCSRTGPGLSQIWRQDRSGALCGGALPKVSSGAAARAYVRCCILVKLRHALSTVLYGREVAPFRSRLQGGIFVDTDFRSHSVAMRSALYIAVPEVSKPSHSSSPVISV